MWRPLLLILALACTACGVKAPPLAPTRPVEAVPPKLDCSPYDPECDATDPNYTPKGR